AARVGTGSSWHATLRGLQTRDVFSLLVDDPLHTLHLPVLPLDNAVLRVDLHVLDVDRFLERAYRLPGLAFLLDAVASRTPPREHRIEALQQGDQCPQECGHRPEQEGPPFQSEQAHGSPPCPTA